MADLADRPGVVVLPPLAYLAALVVGFVLHFLVPVTLPVSAVVRWMAGVALLAAIALAIVARRAFIRAGTNVNPMRPTTAVVTTGPYAFTRNPMYLAMTAFVASLAVATRIGWWLILLAPVLAVIHWGVVLREERYLTRKFGAEYETYRKRVRRYL